MDPLSQAVFGAALAQSFAGKKKIRTAAACGALGGMAPDLDIFIRSDTDPLLAIEYHRHFTHSLAFVPFGGLLVAIILWLVLFRKKDSFASIYIFTTLGLFTHGLLDACTSYGTQLLWPFSDYRVAGNIISIIDPAYTLPLLAFVIVSVIRRSVRVARLGLCLSLCYLGFGYVKHQQVEAAVYALAKSRGHTIERLLLNPTIANNILWRSVYQAGGMYYVDAVYMPLLSTHLIKEGAREPVIDKHTIFPELAPDSQQRKDIERFAHFSQDFIYIHPDHPRIIADLRYGTLPNDNRSMWGVEANPDTPDAHVHLHRLRNITQRHYDTFWLMLNGKFDLVE